MSQLSRTTHIDGSGTANPAQVNKKLNRKVEYIRGSTRRILYQDGKYLKTVEADEAHRFLHGIDLLGDAATPSFDEMLEAVAAKLKSDCERHMLACTESEHYLWDMYQRSKKEGMMVKLPWR